MKIFLLHKITEKAYECLKAEIENTVLYMIDETITFVVGMDASNHIIAAALNQVGRLVAFFAST